MLKADPLDNFEKNLRLLYPVAIGVLVLLSLGSVWFWRERMLFIDPAWIVFNIINTKTFCFAEHRYGAFVTQMFPLLATLANCSLKTILILYSSSFYLFYLSAAIIIGTLWKQRWLSILLVCYFTLVVSDVYFWPNNEVHQGVVWMLLFVGLYQHRLHKKMNWVHHVFLIIFAALALISHMLVMVSGTFLWLLLWYRNAGFTFRTKPSGRWLFYSILLLGLIALRYGLSKGGWYDGGKLEAVNTVSFGKIKEAFVSGQARSFLSLITTNYWWLPIILMMSLVTLLQRRHYFFVLLTLVYVVGYFLLICITYPDSFNSSNQFYMESEWMGIALICCAPLLLIGLQLTRVPNMLTIVISIVFFTRLIYISISAQVFHERYLQLEKITDNLQQSKVNQAIFIVPQQEIEKQFKMPWGLPVESLMLSIVKGYQPAITFKYVNTDKDILPSKGTFASCFHFQPYTDLDLRYFPLDTLTQPTIINHLER